MNGDSFSMTALYQAFAIFARYNDSACFVGLDHSICVEVDVQKVLPEDRQMLHSLGWSVINPNNSRAGFEHDTWDG